MREILFRGKSNWTYGNVKEGDWLYGMTISPHCSTDKEITSYYIGSGNKTIDGKTLGQYTGLTDKNGTKIFEGDIIRYADEGEYRMYLESLECPEEYEGVDFSDMWTIDSVVYGIAVGYPAFDLNNHEWECNGLSNLNESYQYFYEVIGNIHDNPELLEVKTNACKNTKNK